MRVMSAAEAPSSSLFILSSVRAEQQLAIKTLSSPPQTAPTSSLQLGDTGQLPHQCSWQPKAVLSRKQHAFLRLASSRCWDASHRPRTSSLGRHCRVEPHSWAPAGGPAALCFGLLRTSPAFQGHTWAQNLWGGRVQGGTGLNGQPQTVALECCHQACRRRSTPSPKVPVGLY